MEIKKMFLFIGLVVLFAGIVSAQDEFIISDGRLVDAFTGAPVSPMITAFTSTENLGELLPSSSGAAPIRVDNPFAAAGTPVVAKLTVRNNGDEAGFPFNQISLPPNAFGLVFGVDKDRYADYVCPDGSKHSLFDDMSDPEKAAFVLANIGDGTQATVWQSLEGRTCKVYERGTYTLKWAGAAAGGLGGFALSSVVGGVSAPVAIPLGTAFGWTVGSQIKGIPSTVQQKVSQRCNLAENEEIALTFNSWDCMKVAPLESFTTLVQNTPQCERSLDNACATAINSKGLGLLDSATIVMLTDTKTSGIEKGTCKKATRGALAGLCSLSVYQCSIGDEGLAPGESQIFNFGIFVPADTPSTAAAEDLLLKGTIKQEGDAIYSQSAACTTAGGLACHTLYAEVIPIAQEQILNDLKDCTANLFQSVGCGLGILTGGNYNKCAAENIALKSRINAIGDPIVQSQGTFFVIAPILGFRVELILWLLFAAGTGTTFLFGRR